MVKLYAAAGIIGILVAAGWGLIEYGRNMERADNNETVAALQSDLMALGLVIQKQEGEAADNARKLVKSEGERVDAISTNDHQTKEIKRLESIIKQEREKAKTKDSGAVPDDLHYRVIVTDSFVRVWEQARSSSGLPASSSASVLQGGLSTITGDDLTYVLKYAIGRYNSCGIKYNKLWRAADRIIEQCNKKPPQ